MNRLALLLVLAGVACAPATPSSVAPPAPAASSETVGVLVMAHGGTDEWNASVRAAIAPVAQRIPTALAYGMANPYTLQAALDSLSEEGVDRVAVVRMFLSGESFLQQTEFYLGLSATPPAQFVLMGPAARDESARVPLRHDLRVATHLDGLLGSPEAEGIMVERARSLSDVPAEESVLLIAHGVGADDENDRVLHAMEAIAAKMASDGYAAVEVATLREDWEAKRVVAEREIRRYVAEQSAEGRRVLVLPMRLSGFGPYAQVLEGLSYEAGEGLLPHALVADWVEERARRVICSNGWGQTLGSCASALAEPPSGLR